MRGRKYATPNRAMGFARCTLSGLARDVALTKGSLARAVMDLNVSFTNNTGKSRNLFHFLTSTSLDKVAFICEIMLTGEVPDRDRV